MRRKTKKLPIHWVLSGVFTICFYGLFIFLFRFEIAVKGNDNQDSRYLGRITMLPIEDNPRFAWQKNLLASLEILDPTIMTLPHEKYGFSKVRHHEFERPFQSFSSYEIEVKHETNLNPSLFALPSSEMEDIRTLISGAIASPEEVNKGEIRNKKEVPILDPGIYWITPDNKAIDWLPKISLESIPQDIPFSPTSPTVLSLFPGKNSVRVQLDHSCGIAFLDQLGIETLRRSLVKRQVHLDKDQWLKDIDVVSQIMLHWHLPIKQEISIKELLDKEDIRHDWHWF